MNKLFIISLIQLMTSLAFAQAKITVNLNTFSEGQFWVWSYSEKDSQSNNYQQPYLFEKYEVTKIDGPLVTFEMSSSDSTTFTRQPHHKFIADVESCLELGQAMDERKMKKWKIEFYTKSLNSKWDLVSKKHKGLAFTEKFNCYPAVNINESHTHDYKDNELLLFRTTQKGIVSWFSYSDTALAGVAVLRFPRTYKMELTQTNSL